MKTITIAAVSAAIASLLAAGHASAAGDEDILKCRTVQDSLARLTCYDGIMVEAPRAAAAPAQASVTFVSADLRRQGEDYEIDVFSPRMELRPVFRNGSSKTVVGISHRMKVRDAFGDAIVQGTDNLDIRLEPGATGGPDTFYLWEDNPFIRDEPYDRMVGPVSAGTAKVEIEVLKVIYADGTSESY